MAAALIVPASSGAAITKKALRFDTVVAGGQHCTVDADLYTPGGASKEHPVPAVMATNGFGGSKLDFPDLAGAYAQRGYAFLAYSGLGFGNSGCKITLDDREHDGAAGSALISFLGGSKAANDGTKIDYIVKDKTDHNGVDRSDDPRVGMIGGSYGGQIQFAVAGVDPRLDTIIPQITWNDLSYSLAPNNTDILGVTYGTPGITKIDWPALFFALGVSQGLAETTADLSHAGACPNFADDACSVLVQGAAQGYLPDRGLTLLRNASVSAYYKDIKIPTFLTQGQSDNLFDLQESVTTYQKLKAQGTPVKLLWRSAGHSGGGLGIYESSPTKPEEGYESRADLAWFDYYLKDKGTPPGLDFSFLTDWLPHKTQTDFAPAVGVAPSYPVGTQRQFYLSGTDALTTEPSQVKAGDAMMTSPGVVPQSQGGGILSTAGEDQEGTSVSYVTPPLTDALDVVGIPELTLRVDAPGFTEKPDPGFDLELFAKLYDVAPDGSKALIRNLISAARVADPTKPIAIELPGLVHRFAKGHQLRLTVSTSSLTFHGSATMGPVTVKTDPAHPGVLTIPQLGDPTGPLGSAPNGETPFGVAAAQPAVLAAAALGDVRCGANRTLRFRLKHAKRVKVARVRVNGKRVKTVRGKRLRKRVTVALPQGRARVKVVSKLKSGAKRKSRRTYAAC
jgi:ABC-2 type transport system ATP-binding protein